MINEKVFQWLLSGDPSISFQVMRDLSRNRFTQEQIETKQNEIARMGWGKRILNLQNEDGGWGDGIYRKWNGTTYTMILLRRMGLPKNNSNAQEACKLLLEVLFRKDGGINYAKSKKWKDRSETCISGMVLGVLSYFEYPDPRLKTVAQYLLKEQMGDGGWNCRRHYEENCTHSSFHTTFNALDGLREYEKSNFSQQEDRKFLLQIQNSERRAIEFMLQHKIFRSDRTGKIVDKRMTKMAFPPRWHHDFLRCLDFMQEMDYEYDHRMNDALELLLDKMDSNNNRKWKLEHIWPGQFHFKMEKKGRKVFSRWNSLRALRVLNRYYKDFKLYKSKEKKRKRSKKYEEEEEDNEAKEEEEERSRIMDDQKIVHVSKKRKLD